MLVELFANVTDAVISYAVEKLDLAETLKTWLKRDPARLAFQKALARAYSAFARQYPDYTAALFDQSFLVKEAVSELSKILIRNQYPDPALLAQAWSKSIGASSEFLVGATKRASDFLFWLESELKAEQVLQPLFDSRALDRLPHIEAEIEELTKGLQRGLDAALKVAGEYRTITLHINGDIKDSKIVVGDNNAINQYYYSGDFVSLNEYYIPPNSVFQRVRVDEFVGREWLTAKVDSFLNDPSHKSGIFLLVGEAGVGKTAFMAHLVKERRYLHLFAEQAPGQAMLQRALQSLGSQIVTRYQINPYKNRDTLTQTAVFPDFLERLMRLAAQGLCHGEKIIIVCDALDEAGTFPDGNVLGLPNVLPDGVYLILSQRPVNVKLPNVTSHIEKLEAQGNDNLQDMETYLGAVAKHANFAGQIHPHKYSEAFFIRTLKEKSLGVWMYLHYILREMESSSRTPLELENLPTGLVGYYADYWDDWRNGRRGRGEGQYKWDKLYAPLLTTLAAVQEPITIEQLIEWSGVDAQPREVKRLLSEVWRAFITERDVPKGKLYFPYHLSFRDFITGKVDFEKLSIAQGNLVRDLAEQTVKAHQRIVRIFEEVSHGNWEILVEQDYPRLHLCAHFDGAQEHKKLVQLLSEGNASVAWAEAKYQKEETYSGYLIDLQYVWKYAEQERDFALLTRCMLIESSIHTLAAKLPPKLIAELGKAGLWSYAKCLTIVRQKTSSYEKVDSLRLMAGDIPPFLLQEALVAIYEIQDKRHCINALSEYIPHLPDELKAKALADGLAIAHGIQDEYGRASALYELAFHLPDEFKTKTLFESLESARKIGDEENHADALLELVLCLPEVFREQLIAETLTAVRRIRDEHQRFRALSKLVPNLPDEIRADVLADELAAAYRIQNAFYRASALSFLAPYLSDELKMQSLVDALAAAREIQDGMNCAGALYYLAPHLSEDLKLQALAVARNIQNKRDRVVALSNLIAHLSGELQEQVLTEALAVAHLVQSKSDRAWILPHLAPYLPDRLKTQTYVEAFMAAREMQDVYNDVIHLSYLAEHLPDQFKTQALTEALIAAGHIRDEHHRVCALCTMSTYLSDELKVRVFAEALANTCEIRNKYSRARALLKLIPHLQDQLKAQALTDGLTTAREIQDDNERAIALSELALHLEDDLKEQVLIEALTAAREIGNGGNRVATLSRLISQLSGDIKEKLLVEALAFAREIQDKYDRSRGLLELSHQMPDRHKAQVLSEALVAARETLDEHWRVFALSDLLPYLSSELKGKVSVEALTAACEIRRSEDNRVIALSHLAPHLSKDLISQALDVVYEIRDENKRASVLSFLAPYLSNELKTQVLVNALATARQNQNEYAAKTLFNLGPFLDFEVRKEVFQALLFTSVGEGGYQLKDLMKQWHAVDYGGLEEKIIPFIRFTSQTRRYEALDVVEVLILPMIFLFGETIVPEICRAIQDTARWWR